MSAQGHNHHPHKADAAHQHGAQLQHLFHIGVPTGGNALADHLGNHRRDADGSKYQEKAVDLIGIAIDAQTLVSPEIGHRNPVKQINHPDDHLGCH